jgi:hypothetical protein
LCIFAGTIVAIKVKYNLDEESQNALGVCKCCKAGKGYAIGGIEDNEEEPKKKAEGENADELAKSKGKMVMKG